MRLKISFERICIKKNYITFFQLIGYEEWNQIRLGICNHIAIETDKINCKHFKRSRSIE